MSSSDIHSIHQKFRLLPSESRQTVLSCPDGVYVDHLDGSVRFCWVSSPTSQELTRLAQAIARRVGRYFERQGLLERDGEDSYLVPEAVSPKIPWPNYGVIQ
jgi:hypothetical protein